MEIKFTPEAIKRCEEIFGRYPARRAALLPVLHLAQEQFGYVSREVEEYVAGVMELPVSDVHEVVTFYTLLHQRPIGKYHFQVCRNIACHLLGYDNILQRLRERLGISSGETSADRRYSIETVECLAACEMAPMLQLNDDYIGRLTPEKVDQIIEGLKE